MKINSKLFISLSFIIYSQYSVFFPCLRADVSKNTVHPEPGHSDSSLLEESKTKTDILPVIMPIKFETEPKGALLEIDGKIKVNTPKTVLLKEGKHTIKISKEGYEIINETIDIKGEVKRYFYKLQSQKVDPVIVHQAEEKKEGNIIKLVNSGRWDEVVKTGDPAIEILADYIKNEGWYKRAEIADVLGKIGSPKAIVPLTGLLHDDYVEVRKNAVIALGKIGSDQAIEPLRKAATKDSHSDIKAIAMEMLKKMSGYTLEKYITDLVALWKWEELIKIGDTAVDTLINALRDADFNKRSGIAEVLGKVKNNKATIPLLGLLTDEHAEVRKKTIVALGEIGDIQSVEPLRNVVARDSNSDVKSAADDVLKKLLKEALSTGKPHISDKDEIKRILSCINESIQLRDVDKFCQFLSKEDNNFYSTERKKMEDFINEIQILNSSFDNMNISMNEDTANVQYIWNMDFKSKLLGDNVKNNKCMVSLKLKKNGSKWEIFQIKGTSSIASAETSGAKPKPPSMLDTIPPTGSISISNGSAYTNSRIVTLHLSATDNIGVTDHYISTNPTLPSAVASGWQSVASSNNYSENVSYTISSGDGRKTIYGWYKDAVGNISSPASDSIILDTTAPTITITSPTSDSTFTTTTSPISIGGMASDSTSGIRSVKWSNSKGESWLVNGTTNWSIPGVKLSPGSSKITVTAIDDAGNESTDTITIYKTNVDTRAPEGSISINRGASYTRSKEVTLNLSATDDTSVTGYYISTSSYAPSISANGWFSRTKPDTNFSDSVSFTLSPGDGEKWIYVWFRDASGNISNTYVASITLDTTYKDTWQNAADSATYKDKRK